MKVTISSVSMIFIAILSLLTTPQIFVSGQVEDPELVTLVELGQDGSQFSLQYIDPGLYIYGNGIYFGAFFTTGEGVVLIDAPPTFGGFISPIISSVTDEPVKYIVYSHHHLDHIGGANEFASSDEDITYVCHKEAFDKIQESADNGQIPACEITINLEDMTNQHTTDDDDDDSSSSGSSSSGSSSSSSRSSSSSSRGRSSSRSGSGSHSGSGSSSSSSGSSSSSSSSEEGGLDIAALQNNGVFELGSQSIKFDYYGVVHSHGNLWIYSEQHKYLMLIDWVFPGWVPFRFLALAENPTKYIDAHDIALDEDRYNFLYFVGGHLTRVGNRHDVEVNKEFVNDVFAAANIAIQEITFADASGTDLWEFFRNYQDLIAQKCVEILENDYSDREWFQTWQGVDAYIEDHCWWAQEDIAINI